MAKIKVGYKRLYDAAACIVDDDASYHKEFARNKMTISLYVGRNPPLGLGFVSSERYYYPGHPKPFSSIAFGRADIGLLKHLEAVTEIVCLEEIEVTEETLELFRSEDQRIQQELLAIADAKRTEHASMVDLVAGTLGLHFHKQLVIEQVADALLVADSAEKMTQSYLSGAVEMLESISLIPGGHSEVTKVVEPIFSAPQKDVDLGATAMFWLLRAWSVADIYSKFMSLFVPIEVVLSLLEPEVDDEQTKLDKEIKSILKTHGGELKKAILARFNNLKQFSHPSLSIRFGQMAETAKIDGWEKDIDAFRKFNALRNAMLHSGSNTISTSIETGENIESEVRDLEDIAERYVLWALFRRKQPYRSRYRPARKPQ